VRPAWLGHPAAERLACASRTVDSEGTRAGSMLGTLRSFAKEAISLVIAIITFPLRLLRSLL